MTIIDVSKWQGVIDWEQAKSHIDGAVIRLGYRGYADGSIVKDTYADRNIAECNRLGIPYGVYFFSQALDRLEGKAEAEWTLKQLKQYPVQPLLPVYIDTEASGGTNGRADRITKEMRTEAMQGFCEAVESAGYFAGIYASTSWFEGMLIDSKLTQYSHWVADYRGYCGYKGDFAMWQYSSKGIVAGISGNTDMNKAYIDFPAIVKKNGLNGYAKPDTGTDAGTEPKPTEPKPEPVTGGSEELTEGEMSLLVKIIRALIKVFGIKL